MRSLLVSAAALMAVSGSSFAAVTEFQADQAGWLLAAGSVAGAGSYALIDFEDASLGTGVTLAIASDRYASMPAGPTITGIPTSFGNSEPLMYNPNAADATNGVIPTSGKNLLQLAALSIRNGTLEITFAEPVVAIGGFFIDLETSGGRASTGILLDGVMYDHAGPLGNATQQFIGVVSDTPFSVARIELGSGISPTTDGLAFDDLQYVTWVPSPGALSLLGLAALGAGRRRR